MTRPELAAYIRTTGHAFNLPIEDGTQLSPREILELGMLTRTAESLACRIERDDEADKAACAKIYRGEVFSYGE